MRFVRRHPFAHPSPPYRRADTPPPAQPPLPPSADPASTPHPGRLNLLLSWGGWHPDSWADRLPCLLQPMGVNSLRARTGREAERLIRNADIHIAVVDLGLPLDTPNAAEHEQAGPRVLELLRRLDSPPPTVVVKRAPTHRDDARCLSAALRCDAFAVVDSAAADLEAMLRILHRCLHRFYQDRWPGGPPPHTPPQPPNPHDNVV